MALLTGHLLNGKVVGIETPIITNIEEPFKIEDTVSEGYKDVSTIKNWHIWAVDLNRDYLFRRKEIKRLVDLVGINSCISTLSDPPLTPLPADRHYIDPDATATGDWAGYEGFIADWDGTDWVKEPPCHVGYRLLSSEEKQIASTYKIGSVADHFSEFGVPSVVDTGEEFHKNAIESRKARMLRTTVEVYNRLPINYTEVLTNLTFSPVGDLIEAYERWGRKGTLEDYNIDFNRTPVPGIIDYCLSRTPFDGVTSGYPQGMATQSWTTVDGLNMIQFSEEMRAILVDGIYHF